jgi:hypothetical protein
VNIVIKDTSTNKLVSWNPTNLIQYTKEQYQWKAEGENGHPVKSLPPVTTKINGASNISLPPFSLTVINE